MLRKLMNNRNWYCILAIACIVVITMVDHLISISSMDVFWKPFITAFLNILVFLAGFGILSNLEETEEEIKRLERELEQKEQKEQNKDS